MAIQEFKDRGPHSDFYLYHYSHVEVFIHIDQIYRPSSLTSRSWGPLQTSIGVHAQLGIHLQPGNDDCSDLAWFQPSRYHSRQSSRYKTRSRGCGIRLWSKYCTRRGLAQTRCDWNLGQARQASGHCSAPPSPGSVHAQKPEPISSKISLLTSAKIGTRVLCSGASWLNVRWPHESAWSLQRGVRLKVPSHNPQLANKIYCRRCFVVKLSTAGTQAAYVQYIWFTKLCINQDFIFALFEISRTEGRMEKNLRKMHLDCSDL